MSVREACGCPVGTAGVIHIWTCQYAVGNYRPHDPGTSSANAGCGECARVRALWIKAEQIAAEYRAAAEQYEKLYAEALAALREPAGVEEVARAIYEAGDDDETAGWTWWDQSGECREVYRVKARAAIRALGLDPEGGSDATR